MKEIWKPIPSTDSLYEASNFGRIRSTNSVIKRLKNSKSNITTSYIKKPKILSLNNNGNGYLYFTISINNKRRNMYAHRAVCEAFVSNPDNFNIVNHMDGNKSNNNAFNLEWCDHLHNMRHACKLGLNRVGGDKPNAIMVIDNKTGMIFNCIRDASDYFGIKYGLMKLALNRNTSNHKNEIYSRLSKIKKSPPILLNGD